MEDTWPAWAQGYSLTEATPGTPLAYLGKCKVCKAGVRVLVTPHKRLQWANNLGMQGRTLRLKCVQRTADKPGLHVWQHAGVVRLSIPCPQGCMQPGAPLDRYLVPIKVVNGTYTEGKTCDARCTGATGPNCECSCAGVNHGAAHS